MFGSNQYGVNVYAKIGVETGVLAATPNKLIVMLYEGAITACLNAIGYMQKHDIEHKGAMLSKAILIIESGLRLSLDKKSGGEIAESLDALYAYMSQRLATANIHNTPEPVQEVIKLLSDLKAAWVAIGAKQSAQDLPANIQNQAAMAANRNVANYAKV